MTMALKICVILSICLFHFAQSKILNLSCDQIKAFVDGHNNRRLDLASGNVADQPAASEMKYMVWDQELAAKASKWSSNNTVEFNPDITIKSKRFTTGENIYKGVKKEKDFKLDVDKVLSAWFDENKNYTYGPLKSSDANPYTQMVWSDSIYIGCGVSQKENDDSVEYFVICNYGPAGNYLNETPYKSGSPSYDTACPTQDCRHPYGDKC